jgi:hypothetical protein
MFEVEFDGGAKINFGLVIVDMQNGFVAKNGSYDMVKVVLFLSYCLYNS